MALDEYGDFGYRATVAAIYCSLLDLLEEGFLSPEEVRSMVIPTFVGVVRISWRHSRRAGVSLVSRSKKIELFYGEDRIWSDRGQQAADTTGRRLRSGRPRSELRFTKWGVDLQ
jgi:hypothetical protein